MSHKSIKFDCETKRYLKLRFIANNMCGNNLGWNSSESYRPRNRKQTPIIYDYPFDLKLFHLGKLISNGIMSRDRKIS